MASIVKFVRVVFLPLIAATMSGSTFADDKLIGHLETLLIERPDPKVSASFSFALEGCVLTRSILHNKDQTCLRSKGGWGWYRRDLIIDLRLLSTSPSNVRVRGTKHNWEQIEWPFRTGIAKQRRAYLREWEDRHRAILKEDMALPEYDLARRMDKLRALIEEMFPNRRFSGHSERVEYCGGAGALHTPALFWIFGDVRLSLVPVGNGAKIVDLIHRYAQRHCAPDRG